MSGVFYRSDTREPDGDPGKIFSNGFDKRDSKYSDPKLRWPMGKGVSPDIVPQSAVCFTRHFEASPIFPVGDLKTDSWVYVMELDTKDIFNSQCKQWEDVRDKLGGKSDDEALAILWPMFGQERAMNSIPGDSIIGAVRVSRKFNKPDSFMNGGTFKCLSYKANAGFRDGGGHAATLANTLIGKFVSSGEALKMPSQSYGVQKSTGK